MRRVRVEAGFTLIEVLTVLVIVSILVGTAVSLSGKNASADDYARSLSVQINEAKRKSASRGPVRENVVAALGWTGPSGLFPRARVYWLSVGGGRYASVFEVLKENPDPAQATATWVEMSRLVLPGELNPRKWCDQAHLAANQTNGCTVFQDGVTLGCDPSDDMQCDAAVFCYPNGRCDGTTFSVEEDKGYSKSRVLTIPLNGAIVRAGL